MIEGALFYLPHLSELDQWCTTDQNMISLKLILFRSKKNLDFAQTYFKFLVLGTNFDTKNFVIKKFHVVTNSLCAQQFSFRNFSGHLIKQYKINCNFGSLKNLLYNIVYFILLASVFNPRQDSTALSRFLGQGQLTMHHEESFRVERCWVHVIAFLPNLLHLCSATLEYK